jgi:copper transport protein
MRIARILGFFVLFLVTAGTVAGHSQYLASAPAANAILADPPSDVSITLSEAVQPGTAAIRVTDANGSRVGMGPTNVSGTDARIISIGLEAIGPGVFTVAWSATSAVDGHFSSGSFSFAVLNPDGTLPGPLPTTGPDSTSVTISPVEVAARFATFLGLAIAVGGLLFVLRAWLPPGGTSPDALHVAGLRSLLAWAQFGAITFAAGSAGLWALTGATAGDPFAFGGSPFLASVAARSGLGAALTVLLTLVRVRPARPGVLACAGLAVAGLAVGSLGTHSAAVAPPLGSIADAVHLVGVAAWVGGLLAILWVRSRLRDPAASAWAPRVIQAFSRMASYAVGLVLIGGGVLAVLLVGSVERLVETPYGWLVLAKVSLFAPMVALGGVNRYRHVPKVAGQDDTEAVHAVVRNVRWEVLLGALVLAVASVLTVLSPAVASPGTSQSFAASATEDGLRVDFEVVPYPRVPGVYTVNVYLYDGATGNPYTIARNGTLTFRLLTSTDPAQVVPLDGPHGNHLFAETPAMSRAGTWKIDARIARATGFDVIVSFYVALQEP